MKTNIDSIKMLVIASLVVAVTGCNGQAPAPAPGGQEPIAQVPESAPTPAAPVLRFSSAIPNEIKEPTAESGGECGIESTSDFPQGSQLVYSRSKTNEQVDGWLLVRGAGNPEMAFFKLASKTADASYFAPVSLTTREGLGVRLGDAALDNAAFELNASFEDVPAGEYDVQLAQKNAGKVLLCATGRTAKIVD